MSGYLCSHLLHFRVYIAVVPLQPVNEAVRPADISFLLPIIHTYVDLQTGLSVRSFMRLMRVEATTTASTMSTDRPLLVTGEVAAGIRLFRSRRCTLEAFVVVFLWSDMSVGGLGEVAGSAVFSGSGLFSSYVCHHLPHTICKTIFPS